MQLLAIIKVLISLNVSLNIILLLCSIIVWISATTAKNIFHVHYRCIGSTQHLKNLYGAGYTLEMKLSAPSRQRQSSDVTSTRTGVTSPKSTPIITVAGPRRSSASPSLGERDERDSVAGSLVEEDQGGGVMECAVDANIHTPLVGLPENEAQDDDIEQRNSVSIHSG